VDRDGKAEPHVHAARVRLHRRVEEAADIRELLDRRHLTLHLLARDPEQRAVQVRVLAPGEVRMEARADLEERRDPTVHLERAGGRLRGTGDELQQRRLPRSVRPDDAERFAGLDREAHVAERLDVLGRHELPESHLLERAATLAVKAVRLGDMVGANGDGHRRPVSM